MTRDELIARIEAGETGAELLCGIARLVRWRFDEMGPGHDGAKYILSKPIIADPLGVVGYLEIPRWLTSLDAAVSLVGDLRWSVHHDGVAVVWPKGAVFGKTAKAANNPAAALVAAWLKATT